MTKWPTNSDTLFCTLHYVPFSSSRLRGGGLPPLLFSSKDDGTEPDDANGGLFLCVLTGLDKTNGLPPTAPPRPPAANGGAGGGGPSGKMPPLPPLTTTKLTLLLLLLPGPAETPLDDVDDDSDDDDKFEFGGGPPPRLDCEILEWGGSDRSPLMVVVVAVLLLMLLLVLLPRPFLSLRRCAVRSTYFSRIFETLESCSCCARESDSWCCWSCRVNCS